MVRQFAHSDYLTRDLDFVGRVHLVHVSAPVFDSEGVVGATIMLLGPTRELAAAEISDLGRAVTAAAQRASASPGPHRFEPIRSRLFLDPLPVERAAVHSYHRVTVRGICHVGETNHLARVLRSPADTTNCSGRWRFGSH